MSINKGVLIVFCFLLAIVGCTNSHKTKKNVDTERLLQSNVIKIKEAAKTVASSDSFPRTIAPGDTHWECVDVWDWCSGFWPGVLWYAYEFSGDEEIKNQAQRFTAPIKTISVNSAIDHDIGFIVYCSYGNAYRLTGNNGYREVLLAAADTLATLFNPKVGSIHSWPFKPQYPHNTIIDNMMNLELLFWASKNGGSKDLYDIAESHAEVTMNHIVRPDSAVYHLGCFDDETGAFIKGYAHQGYADESMWARGQSWGIYGFAIAYRETGRKDFLETSKKLSDHFLNRLPEDGIPYWDYDDPAIPNTPKDASAAAVAACGMLELSELVKNREDKHKYYNAAVKLISTLSTKEYLCGDDNQAILKHSVGHMPKLSEIDVPIIYADYYYMEALLRLRKLQSGTAVL